MRCGFLFAFLWLPFTLSAQPTIQGDGADNRRLISALDARNSICQFEDRGYARRISHTDAKDWACMKKLAEHGDVFEQFNVGTNMLHRYNADGKENIPEGLRFLKMAARATDAQIAKSINPKAGNASANAMQMLACVYLGDADTASHLCGVYTLDKQGNKTYQPRPPHAFKSVPKAYQWLWLSVQATRDTTFDENKEFANLLTPQQIATLKQTAPQLLLAKD